ncbi:Adenine nucleotide alpha hydrolases-like superfamily protein [Raphanus sativus]|uniref:RING-type E3 ubiquitin transferase n=1 Tax=Raphanus sativus TaxID=3726 RepID=A0A6J0MRU9_RAPSA|nr:U-box domain-containing protein 51-like [Raphanus sativus]KAJ4873673.1 Adenine nucleotide alpha hydrolases-like superfamily protein [Raphanus sativus]
MERNEVREGPIAIAVDRDKTSIQALKWALENHIPQGETVKLVHVIQRSANGPNTDDELSEREQKHKQVARFLPLRCLCMRQNIQTEVVLLDDQDVAKALIEYISHNLVSTFFIGASLKKSITRLFKVDDIPSNVMRWAPDFCNVLVISKGRLSSVRSATRPLPLALPSPSSGTAPLSPLSGTDELPSEMSLSREDDGFFGEFSSLSRDSTANLSDRISTDSSGLSFYKKLGAPQMLDIPRLISGLDDEKSMFSMYLNSPSDEKNCTLASSLLPPMDNADDEKRRLKKELKETMNMYHAACKEALVANEKVAELEIWKKKAEKMLRMAEKTATMTIMEMDKRKLEADTKVVRMRGSDERKVVLDDLGESRIVVKYESLLHIVVVLFVFCFYFTFR